ncbi:MAG TPA: glutathione S-transferase N-terminal domain-containing protein [Burkholderiales bacterium]|nr:glutathione S-transferase N-terminal domain-containing protein [Burkholderiales bacterium]
MIALYELKGKGERRYSLFSWRTRMALKHKRLDFETRPLRLSDKAAIEFSGGKTVPVIRDKTAGQNDFVVRDSWKIAEYLESHYPGAAPLFGGDIGHGVTQAFNTWTDRAVVPAMLQVIAADIHERVDSDDEDYFRQTMEKVLKMTLEESRARREASLQQLGRVLAPIGSALKRQAYMAGASPAYADYILFSVFQWARVMSPQELLAPEDPLCQWRERMLDLFDGFARNVPAA